MIRTGFKINGKLLYLELLCFLWLISCSPILKTITGVRDVHMETVDDLTKFCVKHGIAPRDAYLYLPEKKLTYPDSTQRTIQSSMKLTSTLSQNISCACAGCVRSFSRW